MISLHYTSHTKAYNTIYTACNIVEAIYSFTPLQDVKSRALCPMRCGLAFTNGMPKSASCPL